MRPSPNSGRVGIRIVLFEACSGFTRVTARTLAQPPKAAFVTGLRRNQLPGHAARQLPAQSTTRWVEPSSTGVSRLRGAPEFAIIVSRLDLQGSTREIDMSISLAIARPKNREFSINRIPIATLDAYREFWLPGARAIGAHWLPLFESYACVQGKDFEDVSKELVLFRNWLQSAPFNEDAKRSITSRVDCLLDGLKALYAESGGDIELSIG
jgi:hypothetical protein